jgi:hypothetical protein
LLKIFQNALEVNKARKILDLLVETLILTSGEMVNLRHRRKKPRQNKSRKTTEPLAAASKNEAESFGGGPKGVSKKRLKEVEPQKKMLN